MEFCPGVFKFEKTGKESLAATRLNYEAAKYNRFRLRYVNVAFKSTSSTMSAGSFALGILSGPTEKSVTSQSDILKLRPFSTGAIWKSTSISVGPNVQSQPYYKTNSAGDDDGAPFTLYFYASGDNADKAGVIEVSYLVEFSFPKI